MKVYITYKAAINYGAAIVDTPCTNIRDALDYAYRWTQNIDGSWSNKIGNDANDRVSVCHYLNDGSGLRSSMCGDQFSVQDTNQKYKIFECAPFGFEEIV
mgnify:CR=1 FL=1